MNLAHEWFNNACPFNEMRNRTSNLTMGEIASLSRKEVMYRVFPEILPLVIAGPNKVAEQLTYIWACLHLRQKSRFELPIPMSQKFSEYHAASKNELLNGWEFINSVGRPVMPTSIEESRSRVYSRFNKSVRSELAVKYGLSNGALNHALESVFMAEVNPDVMFLTYASATKMLKENLKVPSNLGLLDHNWLKTFDFYAEMEDVVWVIQWLSTVLPKNAFDYRVEGSELILSLDNEYEFTLTQDGVYETCRDRRFSNMLLIRGNSGYNSEFRIPGRDMTLLNSHGSFLYGLLVSGSRYLADAKLPMGKLYRMLTEGTHIPINSLKEVGYQDPDRMQFDRYATVERGDGCCLPVLFEKVWEPNRTFRFVIKPEIGIIKSGPAKHLVDRSALLCFNLVRKAADYLVGGRSVCIQAKHLPAESRQRFVDAVTEKYGGKTVNPEKFIAGLSSKLPKLVKRCIMPDAVVGEIEGGETRGFRRFGQPEGSKNNWLVEACLSTSHILPPGMAFYWGEDPSMMVRHTEVYEPHLTPEFEIEQAVTLDFDSEISLVNGWYTAEFNNIPIAEKGAIGMVVFKTLSDESGVWYLTTKTPNALLNKVEWRWSNSSGTNQTLKIRVTTYHRVNQLKGRNYQKCMLARYFPEVIHNSANPKLEARALFPRDTNKWLDGVQQIADVAACTAIKNQDPEGLELIKEANEYAGELCEELVWSPVLAFLGVYDRLIDWFKTKFHQVIWMQVPDPSGEYAQILQEMYCSWFEYNPEKFEHLIPSGAKDIHVLSQDKKIEKNTNILIFFELRGVSHIYHRGECFVGTPATGPVWQPIKGEISSVRAAVGSTPMMSGVARAIEEENKKLAFELVEDGFANAHLGAAFQCMAKGLGFNLNGESLPILDVISHAELFDTEKLKSLVLNPENQDQLLLKLLEGSEGFNKYILRFQVNDKHAFTLYLPAIARKDSNLNFKGGGLGDLVTNLMVQTIMGCIGTPEFKALLIRVNGALRSCANGASFIKSVAYARSGVQCKPVSYPGIPLQEIWVRYSGKRDSVYQCMRSTFRRDPEGAHVVVGRAPMVTPTKQKVRVVYDTSRWFEILPEFSMAVSPLATIKHGGDLDGDGNSVFLVDGSLELDTIESLKENLVLRTGSDQLEPGGSYWGDWYEIVHPDKTAKKCGISQKNLSYVSGINKDDPVDRKSLPIMLEASTQMIASAVGWVHRLFLTGDIYTSLVRELRGDFEEKFSDWVPDAFTEREGFINILAEVYEVPLAGLDWDAYDAFYKFLIPVIQDGQPFALSRMGEFSEALDRAGMNASAAKDLYECAQVVHSCRMLGLGKEQVNMKSSEGFLCLVAELSALASKGQLNLLNPKHRTLVNKYREWKKVHNIESWVNKSVVLYALDEYCKTMLAAQMGEEVDLHL